MIRLQRSMIAGLVGPDPQVQAVLDSLQNAIKLEHATIPLYLYAMYSLDPVKNPEIASIIHTVVIEEMLHMTLASNVLNALGGSPRIDAPGFIPTYPGPLPGGVQSDLNVNLAPFSMKQLDTFLHIEEPEDPLNFPSAFAEAATITIGQFYAAISTAIGNLKGNPFVNPPRNQVGPDLMRESVAVVDVATAQKAINTIVEQGEGTTTSPGEVVGGRYAHYYRLMEIKKGHRLVEVPGAVRPEDKYAYAGKPITFDPAAVYAAPTNPAVNGYPAGSAQAFANDNFNYTYTGLLLALHALFNGQATAALFDRTIGLMMSLKGQAKAMMSGIPNPAVVTGPSFQYQPINPANA